MDNRSNSERGRVPMQARARNRWLLAAGIAGLWLLCLMASHSLVGGTVLLLMLGIIVGGTVVVLRLLGFGKDHPLMQRAASRPWRDGRDVLRMALGHLSEVFIVTPNGSLLAPNAVELRMNPDDVGSLAELIDLSLVNASAAEAYAAEVAASSARIARDVPIEVAVIADPAVPLGRYRLRQRPGAGAAGLAATGAVAAGFARAGPAAPYAAGAGLAPPGSAVPLPVMDPRSAATNHYHDGRTRSDPAGAPTLMTGATTVTAPAQNPLLRLVTDGAVTETRVSGARAGRGGAAELRLPAEPTVSRVHATFTCSGGQWRVTAEGRNGVLLNDVPVAREHAVHDGDRIRWGRQSTAPVSTVIIA